MSRLRGRRAPGSIPDSTKDPPCMGPVARQTIRNGQTPSRWCGAKIPTLARPTQKGCKVGRGPAGRAPPACRGQDLLGIKFIQNFCRILWNLVDTAVEQFNVGQTEEEIWLKRCSISIQQCDVSASTETPRAFSTKSKRCQEDPQWRKPFKFFKNSNKNVEEYRGE
ncbi:hypothetical protein AVEN_104445-1 [Araneus ventricosus]|uniref:Uncharacterized protein n=1 Tax=Araneus ventricosus TaxID=182803 RepID=A0A4Y2UEC8_ARAVE|nr:hypothetical protein AVEN_104445-1 [Araneus ventricosus]